VRVRVRVRVRVWARIRKIETCFFVFTLLSVFCAS
jgi:hypothetical protein